jgi:hypothetical protein
MTTLAARPRKRPSCRLCAPPRGRRIESDRLMWITYCQRQSVPIVALRRHAGSPTAGEWRLLEVRAKRSFPGYRWLPPAYFNGHFYLHAVDLKGRCGENHAAA